jgi:adenylate cyclase
MIDRLARMLFVRLGRRYKLVFVVTQIPASVLVAIGVVGLLASYYHPSIADGVLIAVTTSLFTASGILLTLTRHRAWLDSIAEWDANGVPTDTDTVAAWDAAVNFPMRSFRRDSLTTNAIAAIPSIAVIAVVLGLPPSAYPVLLAAGAIAAAYGTVLTYSIAEILLRPLVESIAASLPESFAFTANGLSVRKRLLISLPVFAAMTGLVVAALVRDGGGTQMLASSVAAALLVGLALSLELTLILSRSITTPIARLRDALALVRGGDYDVRVPVVTSDEFGELADAFNRMAQGLAERERIREAFGTYLDKDVAGFILSGRFPEGGVEVEVSIMFCDVPGFTTFAESASASEVISSLNTLFELLVPIIDRHGGHVDKFIGDGLLAVFGAPEGFPDHADRALAAGLEILAELERDAGALDVCIGINTGRVAAGSIGGAGRLNFSVIGDAVNVAARVEEATRSSGDSLLLTRATRDALLRPALVTSRGTISLKGKSEPVEVFTPQSGDGERDGARGERDAHDAGDELSADSGARARRDPEVRPLR